MLKPKKRLKVNCFFKTFFLSLFFVFLHFCFFIPRPTLAFSFLDDTQTEFDQGTYSGTQWDGGNTWVESNMQELPNGGGSGGWIDMTGNKLLMHMNQASWNGTPGEVVDSSGLGNHGTRVNNATTTVSGKISRSGVFDGDADYVNVAHNSNLNPSTELTISVWVNLLNPSSNQKIINKVTSTPRGYILGVSGSNIYPEIWDSAGTHYSFQAGSFNANTWTHLAITWKSNGNMIGYINGAQVRSIPASSNPIFATTNNLIIGEEGWLTNAFEVNGRIDEAAVWTHELSSSEIETIYNNQSSKFISRVVNAGNSGTWTNISWTPEGPTCKELPNSAGIETGYNTGNIDMTGNVLLTHMNEASWNGTPDEAVDSSGTENHGVRAGNATTTSDGKFLRAGLFDGSNDYVQVAHDSSLQPSTAITVMAWIFPYRTAETKIVAKVSGSPFRGYILGKNSSGGVYPEFWDSAGTRFSPSGGSSSINSWTHIAATYDAQNVKGYLNGVEVASVPSNGNPLGSNTNNLLVGDWDVWDFLGKIDEVAVFSRSLSGTEISNIYKRGATCLKYQVRSCDDASCSGETFIGPDGTVNTYYSELQNATLGLPTLSLTNVPDNQFFQYRAFFESDNSSYSPELNNFGGNGPLDDDNAIPFFTWWTLLLSLILGFFGYIVLREHRI